MEPTKNLIVSHLRHAFHMGDPLTRAPLPEPWIELLHRLDEKEREGLEARKRKIGLAASWPKSALVH